MILEVLMEMMIPYLMASIIDDGVNKGDMKHICVVGAGMLVIAAIGLFAGIMGGVYGAKACLGRLTIFSILQYFNNQTLNGDKVVASNIPSGIIAIALPFGNNISTILTRKLTSNL